MHKAISEMTDLKVQKMLDTYNLRKLSAVVKI